MHEASTSGADSDPLVQCFFIAIMRWCVCNTGTADGCRHRAAEELGLRSWVPLEESLRDMVEDLASKGLVRHPLSRGGIVLGKQAAWLLALGLVVLLAVVFGAAAALRTLRG